MCIFAKCKNFKEFKKLVDKTKEVLKNDASLTYKSLNNQKGGFWINFEKKVCYTMRSIAGDLTGEWIKYIPNSTRFPDIVAYINNEKGFGLEVKTITSKKSENSWTVLGGSIMESTRVDKVDRILVLCAKKNNDNSLSYRSCKFEDCIVGVAVTHSPRYVLEIPNDGEQIETIFDKIKTKYDEVRKSDNPFAYFRDVGANSESNGSKKWWKLEEVEQNDLENHEQVLAQQGDQVNFKFWDEIDNEKRRFLIAKMFVEFPDVFCGNYKNAGRWLVASEYIICNNLRDKFSAGGKSCINDSCNPTYKIHRIYKRLSDHKADIIQIFQKNLTYMQFNDWKEKVIPDEKNSKYRLDSKGIEIVSNILEKIENGIKNMPNLN